MSFVLTVGQLNRYVGSLLEGDDKLSSVLVSGEISNFKSHYSSGHIYFSLKDNDGVVKSVMFKSSAERIKFLPTDGMSVICRGRVALYEKEGQYQLYVTDMQPDGEGALALQFLQVKQRLEDEGMFSQQYKKPLPRFPKTVGIITSEHSAALKDIISILNRRWHGINIKIYPVAVQGMDAPKTMINAIIAANNPESCDVLILGRGGGSAEDLSAFNDEMLAREVFNCKIPIVSAVGHETDYTICDFVADMRAPTPSAAAEIVVPNYSDVLAMVHMQKSRLSSAYSAAINQLNFRVNSASLRLTERNAGHVFNAFQARVAVAELRLRTAVEKSILDSSMVFKSAVTKLDAYSPLKTLARGYSVAMKDDKLIKSIQDIKISDSIVLLLCNGKIACTVDEIKEKNEDAE